MRRKTVILSALIHVVVFGVALSISQGRSKRRATSIAVIGEKQKAEPKKEPAKPKPMLASARPESIHPQAAPRAEPARPTSVTPEAAPAETNIEMGNDDGPGIAIGPPIARKPGATAPSPSEKRASPVKKEKALAPKSDNPEADSCSEAPSKPMPVQRPNEIEYTQEARASGVEGRLILKITVGADGAVLKVEVVSSVDPALDAAAIAAVKTWVFKPSMRCGKAMAGGSFTLARRFELGD